MADHNSAERVAQLVAQAMVTAGKSKTWLAEQTGIPYSTLGRKLRAVSEFNYSETFRIAEALGIHPADLVPTEFKKAVA